MAENKSKDPEETSGDPTGSESADTNDLEEIDAEQPAELTEDAEITDPEDAPDDGYVDDPATPDINEAKLDRASDEVADDIGTGSEAGSARAGSGRTRTTAPVRKSTDVRTVPEVESGKTTPAAFVRQSLTELRKVVWPTGNQVQQYFVVVLVFVLFIMTVVSLLDLGLGWVILKVFGGTTP